MREHEVMVPSEFELAGVLCLPDGASASAPEGAPAVEPQAAILLIGGTGADTRDGDLVLPGRLRGPHAPAPGTLRRIAHHLARHGLASFRWDRRGFGASHGRAENSDYSTDLTDAVACFRWLQSRPEIDGSRVGVAGHSAGALTACHVCRDVPGVAAAGLLGALASPIEDMLRWNWGRAQRHWEEFTPEQQATITREMSIELLRGECVERLIEGARRGEEVVRLESEGGLEGEVEGVSVEVRTTRLRQDLRTDYAAEFRHVSCPALVLHGGDDLNVPVGDALVSYTALRRAGNDDVELVVLPGLDHYFNPVSADPALCVWERLTREALRRPMSGRALDVIASWAVRTLGPGRRSGKLDAL